MNVKEAAQALGVSVQTVYRLLAHQAMHFKPDQQPRHTNGRNLFRRLHLLPRHPLVRVLDKAPSGVATRKLPESAPYAQSSPVRHADMHSPLGVFCCGPLDRGTQAEIARVLRSAPTAGGNLLCKTSLPKRPSYSGSIQPRVLLGNLRGAFLYAGNSCRESGRIENRLGQVER